jgi:membrane associated rhomboid family serine protease
VREAALEGQWWRLVTASLLHADAPHALGNAAFFLVLGWAAAERFGSGLALAVWLESAVAGFLVSLSSSEVTLTVGASGGLFGLLGCAAVHALLTAPPPTRAPRRRLQVFSAAALFLAFTAFSPEANWQAHLGGFVAGVVLGAVSPRRPPSAVWQAVLGLGVAVAVLLAWSRALTAA